MVVAFVEWAALSDAIDLLVRFMPHIVAYARRSHPKYGVGIEIFVALHEDVGNESVVALLYDPKVHMPGSHRTAFRGTQHVDHRAVGWNGVAFREDGSEADPPLFVGTKNRA